MNIAEPFVRRPVMTTLVMAGILIFGVAAFRELPVNSLPNVDFPTLQVSASLPGASPGTMAAAVATPLEKQFSTIAGVDSMSSVSNEGLTQITLQFALDRNIDAAAQDVQSAIAGSAGQLPATLTHPPTARKVNPADAPILFLALTSATLPISQVDEYAETFLAQRLSTISGVAQVQVFGAQKYAVRIKLDPGALASRDLAINDLEQAISQNNVNLPVGTLYGPARAISLQASGQLQRAADYAPLVVAYRNGAPVRLDELGRVVDGVENDKVSAWFNGTRGIVLAIQRQPGTNTIEIVDKINALLPKFRSEIPPACKLDVLYDRSQSIRESVRDVEVSLLLALVLVVGVIFAFLRSLRATLIPSLALPMSIIGTFSLMALLGFNLDNLSLMALTLCVGFVVDDAIVMLENITRHVEMGKDRLSATLDGSKEVAFTIVSMTLSLAAVFIPVLFMGGIIGRLLHEFAVTIIGAVLISGFVSLTLTPMLCSRMLREERHAPHGALYRFMERAFDALQGLYDRTLRWTLAHRRFTLAWFAAVFAAAIVLFGWAPKGFLPNEDTGQLLIFTEAAQDISFDAMSTLQQQLSKIVQADPAIAGHMSAIGPSGSSSSLNLGRLFVRLKPRNERDTADVIVQRLRPQLMSVPGIKAYIQSVQTIRIGGMLTKSPYQYTLQAPDTAMLYEWAPKIEAKLKSLPEFVDVTSDLQIARAQVRVDIDRDRAASFGITPQQLESALYNAYGAHQVSTIYTDTNQYAVILELDNKYQADPTVLKLLHLRSASGQMVPLDSVATLSAGVGPLSVAHLGQLPAVTLSFDLKPGTTLSQAVASVQRGVAELGVPAGVTGSFQGAAQAFQSSLQGMGVLLLLSVFVIYLVLGVLYESYIHPVTILSGLPTAGFGAFIALLLFRVEINMYAFVGVIMLVGIVKKNAIMMVDFAIEARRVRGLDPERAIYEACLTRFRPIMMTTMAALMGSLPIALSLGAGGEARRPLGVAVVGGLVVSQVLTLYVTPVIYLYFERLLATRAAQPQAA